MIEAVNLEKEFIRDCLPVNSVGLGSDEFCCYADYIADRSLMALVLMYLILGSKIFPWLAETMDVRKNKTFLRAGNRISKILCSIRSL